MTKLKRINLFIYFQSSNILLFNPMSDSDSQPEQTHFRKVGEQELPHIKQILAKGKKILPSYDDQALYGLFKRYYSVENIFLNELRIIAKRMKGDIDDDPRTKDQKWINVGRQVRTKVNKTKYNFLEDKELLRRAQQYLKNKKLVPERRYNVSEPRDTYQKQQNRDTYTRQDNRKKENPLETSNRRQYQDKKPKQKFVEKVEDSKIQTKKPETKNNQIKKIQSPVKELKYKEKTQQNQPIANKTSQLKSTQHKLSEHKVIEHKAPEQKNLDQKPQMKVQNKTQQNFKNEQNKKVIAPTTQQPKPEQTLKKEEILKTVQPHQQAPKKVEQIEKPVEAQKGGSQGVKQQQTSYVIPKVENYNPAEAAKNFEQSCNQNSFVLNFIKPQPYPQKVSYIRTADGSIKNVQIRVTGTSTQGASKAV